MPEDYTVSAPPLEAKSPYELRVNLGKGVPEVGRPDGARDRGHGLPALVHDRGDRGRPRRARRRLDERVHVAMHLLPQPRHLDDEQRRAGDDRQGHRAVAQVPPRPQGDVRRFHAEWRRAADAAPVRGQALRGGEGDGRSHGARHQRLLRRPAQRRRAGDDRSRAARHQDVGSGAAPPAHGHGRRPQRWNSRGASRRESGPSGCASSWCPA